MRELSLFSGAGGGLLGTKLLGFQHIGYVEFNDYCQQILAKRIQEGYLDEAPIFTDVRAFASIAHHYRGFADVVSAGFPCQPFSVAGKQKGADDERNMWPATIDIIRKVKPRVAFLENVPGLLSVCDESAGHFRYIQQVFGDLAEAGYDARWCVLGADDCGAPHRRKRLWIYAYSKHDGPLTASELGGYGETILNEQEGQDSTSEFEGVDTSRDVADTEGKLGNGNKANRNTGETSAQKFRGCSGEEIMADTMRERLERQPKPREGYRAMPEEGFARDRFVSSCAGWWAVEPELGRVADGVADRVDRLKALGNGQVPIVAKTAFELLTNNHW